MLPLTAPVREAVLLNDFSNAGRLHHVFRYGDVAPGAAGAHSTEEIQSQLYRAVISSQLSGLMDNFGAHQQEDSSERHSQLVCRDIKVANSTGAEQSAGYYS